MSGGGRWRPPEAPTYSVSELGEEIRDLLSEAYASVWVVGEIHRARASGRGHFYFELVEKGAGDAIVGKADAVLWRTDHMRVARLLRSGGQRLAEGQEIRCRVQVDYYPPAGRLQLVVREVDPLFTLGSLARRRAETLAALDTAGLLARNRAHRLARIPLDLALITSPDSAAFHDFMSGLDDSEYGFRVLLIPAAVQGVGAERALVAAFRTVEHLIRNDAPIQAVVLTRGGGARTDLAVFDSRSVAEAAAHCSRPLLTGLGHETDEAVVDHVAHTALKTPTQVAAFLVERVGHAESEMLTLQAAIAGAAHARLQAADHALAKAGTVARGARQRLTTAGARIRHAGHALSLLSSQRLRQAQRRLDTLGHDLGRAAPRAIDRVRDMPQAFAARVAHQAKRQLHHARATVDAHARLCAQVAPERVLARGFSITRAEDGTVIRRAEQLTAGDPITTQVAAGTIHSTVENSTAEGSKRPHGLEEHHE